MITKTRLPLDPAVLARSIDPAPYARSALTAAGLTRIQQQVLDYVRIFTVMNDQLPPASAIAEAFGWASNNAAYEHLAKLEAAGHLARNELGNLMLSTPSRKQAAPMQLHALQRLAEDLINPEELGFAATPEIRDRARIALGLRATEFKPLISTHGASA